MNKGDHVEAILAVINGGLLLRSRDEDCVPISRLTMKETNHTKIHVLVEANTRAQEYTGGSESSSGAQLLCDDTSWHCDSVARVWSHTDHWLRKDSPPFLSETAVARASGSSETKKSINAAFFVCLWH